MKDGRDIALDKLDWNCNEISLGDWEILREKLSFLSCY